MFESVPAAPPDPILGLSEAFNRDPHPDKINLSVGIFKDAHGKTPTLEAVKEAERRLIATEHHKTYRPIDGDPDYDQAVQSLMFGPDSEVFTSERARTAHTPGGTGGLRVVADTLHRLFPKATVWLSEPTWANHPNIFKAAGVATQTYPYFDPATNALAFDAMMAKLRAVPAGDVVLLHGCCHNPTGVDPTPDQWRQIADVVADRGILPLLDFAYQGFGDGLVEDAAGLREMARPGCEMLVCSSYSKNFGLYSERVGAATVVGADPQIAANMLSQIKISIRTNYSNPPAHGAEIVATILDDVHLCQQWKDELAAMRNRIRDMRQLLHDKLEDRAVTLGGDNSFIVRQRGMFSFSGLNLQQVQRLRDRHAIYIVGSGRINVAGITQANVDRLCDAIAEVVMEAE